MNGHELLLGMGNQISASFPPGINFIEVGSERGSGSTKLLANMCNQLGYIFTTVDADPDVSQYANDIVKSINKEFKAVCGLGEEYIRDTPDEIHIAYLDAFDLENLRDTPRHEKCQSPRATYERRGVKITSENCFKMHLDAVKFLDKKMPSGGLVVFDDVWNDGLWRGKGETAIPWMLKNGFELVYFQPNAAAFVRT